MENETDTTFESTTSHEQQERERLEGLEREKNGMPYSKQEHLRILSILEEQQKLEQRTKRDYTDYTMTTLVFVRELDLEKQHEWSNILSHVRDHENCLTIVWGRYRKNSRRVLVLFGWSKATSQQQKEYGANWDALRPLLKSQPQSRHIALCTPSLLRHAGPNLKELMIIQGSDQILSPPDPLLLFGLEELAERTISQIGHNSPVEFAGYTQGITPSLKGQRTIAILFSWVDEIKRLRFIDPKQHSFGIYNDDGEYDKQIATQLRDLEAHGATVESHLCNIQTWYRPVEPEKRKKGCIIM